jgi:hypothetical protein
MEGGLTVSEVKSKEEQERGDYQVAHAVLVIGGIVLPLLGFLFGPGTWWAYTIWLSGGLLVWWLHRRYGVRQGWRGDLK